MYQKFQKLAELTKQIETMTEEKFEASVIEFEKIATEIGISGLNVSTIASQVANGLLKTEAEINAAVADYLKQK